MKYHTTPMTIIISCLLLALSIVLVWAGMFFLGLRDPGAVIASDIITSFASDGASDLRIEFSSIDRTIWKSIQLNDIAFSVRDGEGRWHKVLEADVMTFSMSVQQLVFSFFMGNDRLSVDIADFSLVLDPETLPVLLKTLSPNADAASASGDATGKRDPLRLWLARTAFSVRLRNGKAAFIGDGDRINATGIAGNVNLGAGLTYEAASLRVAAVTGAIGSLTAEFDALSVTLGKNATGGYRVSAAMDAGSVGNDMGAVDSPMHVGVKELRCWADLADLRAETIRDARLQYVFGSVDAKYASSSVALPSANGTIALGEGVSWTAMFDIPGIDADIDLRGKKLMVRSPAWRIDVTGDAFEKFDISAYASDSQSLSLHMDNERLCSISGLQGRFELDMRQESMTGGVRWGRMDIPRPSLVRSLLPGQFGLPVNSISSTSTQINIAFSNKTKDIVAELYSELATDLTWSVPSDASCILTASVDYHVDQKSYDVFADLESLFIDSVPGETSVSYSWLNSASLNEMRLDLRNEKAGVNIGAIYDLDLGGTQRLSAILRLDEFAPAAFRPLIGSYVPVMEAYMDDTTRLVGNLQLEAVPGTGAVFGWDGRGSFELGIIDLKVGERFFNGATTFVGSLTSDHLDVETFTATTEGYRLQYNGGLVLDNFLPEGELTFARAEDGRQLARIDFSLLPPDSYSFTMDSEFVPDVMISGRMNWQSRRIVNSEATLTAWNMVYPLSMTIDFNTFTLEFSSHGLALSSVLNDGGHSRIALVAESFDLPRFSERLPENWPLKFSGTFALDIPLDTYDWTVGISGLQLGNLPAVEGVGSVGFDFSATDRGFVFTDFAWDTGKGEPLKGSLEVESASLRRLLSGDFEDFKGMLHLVGEPSENVSVSVYSDDLNRASINGLIDLTSLNLGRFYLPLGDMSLNVTAVGSSDLKDALDIDGFASLVSRDFIDNPIHVQSSFHIDDETLSLSDVSYINGNLLLQNGNVGVDCVTGETSLSIEPSFIVNNADKPREYSGGFALSARLPLSGGVFNLPASISACGALFTSLRNPAESTAELELALGIKDVVLGSEYHIPDATYRLSLHGGLASINGGPAGEPENISGTYRLSDGTLDLLLDPSFLIGFHATGTVTPRAISVEVADIFFPLPLINITFMKPIVWFLEGDIHGNVRIEGEPLSPDFYGMVWADRIDATTFWLPDDILSMKNPVVTIEEGFASNSWTVMTCTNLRTGKIVQTMGKASCNLDGWLLDYYQLETHIPNDPVFVWVPLLGPDIDIKGYVSGDFTVYGEGVECWLSGPIAISDTTISFGISGLPAWYTKGDVTSTNMQVTTGKNVNFYFPSEDSPIISVTFDEGQHAAYSFDHRSKQISVDGELGFRTGEIYYFQKNFYVTEGSFRFRTDAFTQQINPVINLRARIRDFDSSGNKVDIYLVLQDSTLDNLSPRFESVPSLTTNEILQILGQSILPSTAYGQVNVSSVVSLAATATDVISRLGIIDTGSSGLARSIKGSLGLDMFTIRSNIVQNILFDVLPGTSLVSSSATPLARYLNNTTVFLGKYFGRDFFLQGMIHFSAASNGTGRRGSFLADDLEVDMELSVEWANPMCTFSLFTQPEELSLFNILDTIGFSVTKRIEF